MKIYCLRAALSKNLISFQRFSLCAESFFLGLTAVAAFGTLQAQTARRGHRGVTHATVDSTTLIADNYAHRLDSLSQAARTADNDSDDVLENPYYFPLFAGNTLYDAQLRDALGRLSTERMVCRVLFRVRCWISTRNVLIW